MVSGSLNNDLGKLEFEDIETNLYTIVADEPGRYTLPSARVEYENIDGDPVVDESDPIELVATVGQLLIDAQITPPNAGSEKVNFLAIVTDPLTSLPIQDVSVQGVLQRQNGPDWETIQISPLGWSSELGVFKGVSPDITTWGNHRAYVISQKDLYDDGQSTSVNFTAISIPDVVGFSQATAEYVITAVGLNVGTITNAYSDIVPIGDVINQNPVSGSIVVAESEVDIIISLGLYDPDGKGTVSIDVTPNSASWSVSGPSEFEGNGQNFTGDRIFTAAPVGAYAWTGETLAGYVTPSPEIKSLASNETINFNKAYISQPATNGWKYLRYDLSGSACTAERTTVATKANLISLFEISGVERNVLTGDVDGDGFIDIVTTSGSEIQIYAGDGTLKRSIPLPRESSATVLEDFDNDGVLDIGLGGGGTGFSAYICKGDGTLLKTFEGEHAGASTVSMLPLGMSKGKVLIEYNAGYARTPRGFASFDYETSAEDWYYQIGPAGGESSVADMNNDGLLDVTRSTYTTHNGASGNGTTDGDNYLVVVDETGQMKLSQMYPSPRNGNARHLFVDFADSGSWKILGFEGHDPTYYPGLARIHLYSNSGITEHIFEGPDNADWTYAVGDIDGDGIKEVVAKAGWTDTTTYVLDSTLTKIRERTISGQIKLLCDLTGDGNLEIVLLDDSGQLRIVDKDLNDIATVQAGDRKGQLIASDINADGRVDLLCLTDKMYAFTFEASPVLGDVDGNKKLELSDAILAFQIIAGLDPIQTIYKSADVNGDGKIGMEEVIFILKIVSGFNEKTIFFEDFDGNGPGFAEWSVWSQVPAGEWDQFTSVDGNNLTPGTGNYAAVRSYSFEFIDTEVKLTSPEIIGTNYQGLTVLFDYYFNGRGYPGDEFHDGVIEDVISFWVDGIEMEAFGYNDDYNDLPLSGTRTYNIDFADGASSFQIGFSFYSSSGPPTYDTIQIDNVRITGMPVPSP